jgi:hypothetical protein
MPGGVLPWMAVGGSRGGWPRGGSGFGAFIAYICRICGPDASVFTLYDTLRRPLLDGKNRIPLNHWRHGCGLTQKAGRIWPGDSVGGRPTGAVETTALPGKLMIGGGTRIT